MRFKFFIILQCFSTVLQVFAPRTVILTQGFCGFTQSLQANSGIIPQIMPRPLPSTSFTKYYLLIILSLYSLNYSIAKESITTWSLVLETPPVAQPQNVMETEASPPCSQEPATGLCPMSDEFSQYRLLFV